MVFALVFNAGQDELSGSACSFSYLAAIAHAVSGHAGLRGYSHRQTCWHCGSSK